MAPKMKKSKTDPSVKKKAKNPTLKKKRKTASHTGDGSKITKKEKIPRKSRWEEAKHVDKDPKKTETAVLPTKTEEENARESPRIKSLLEDKKKAVELLFLAVSGKVLDDIIPDYLRKRPIDELKKLCLVELEKMSNDEILDTISGKVHPLFKEQETQTDLNANSKDIVAPVKEDIKTEKENEQLENVEMEINDAQSQEPPEVLEEVAKNLGISDDDAELVELEMRARAIRSLLKLKSNEEFAIDSNLKTDE